MQCARGRTARQWHEGLIATYGETALTYRKVARRIRAFKAGHESVADVNLAGCQWRASAGCCHTVRYRSTSDDTWVRPRNRIIAYDCAAYAKESPENEENCIAVGSTRFDGSAAMDMIRRRGRGGDAFLRRIITLDETWARSYEPQLKYQYNGWRRYVSQCIPLLMLMSWWFLCTAVMMSS